MRSEIRIRHWKERLPFIKSVEGIREGWDPCLQTFEGHRNPVNAVAFSPDGKVLGMPLLCDQMARYRWKLRNFLYQ